MYCLHSLDDPILAFSVEPPDALGVEYQIELSDADIALLGLTDPADALVVVIIYRDTETVATPGGKISASTRFPLVLNPKTRLGMQKILMEVQPSGVYRAR